MDTPDHRLFDADVASAEFRAGAVKGHWGFADADTVSEQPTWPVRILWIRAAPRDKAPDRYYLQMDLSGYRGDAPTGTFWNPKTKTTLEFALRPKGKLGSRVAMVFRADWENGKAFYHPYDRVAAKGHPDWPKTQPSLIWDSDHTIVDYLEEVHSLLNCGDYIGV